MATRGYREFNIARSGTSILGVQSRYARRLLAPLFRGGAFETVRDLALSISPGWRAHLRDCQARNSALIEALLEVTGSRVIVDSSKSALRLKYLLRIPNLDVRVIRLIRDGRAVALAYTDEWTYADSQDPNLRSGGTGDRRAPQRNSIPKAAMAWKRSNESCDAMIKTLPTSQWTSVTYEELCTEPRRTLEKIISFLGLDPCDVSLDFRHKCQHVIGNGMRMDLTSEIRLDERWKSNLTKHDIEDFQEVAGTLNRRYGYL